MSCLGFCRSRPVSHLTAPEDTTQRLLPDKSRDKSTELGLCHIMIRDSFVKTRGMTYALLSSENHIIAVLVISFLRLVVLYLAMQSFSILVHMLGDICFLNVCCRPVLGTVEAISSVKKKNGTNGKESFQTRLSLIYSLLETAFNTHVFTHDTY